MLIFPPSYQNPILISTNIVLTLPWRRWHEGDVHATLHVFPSVPAFLFLLGIALELFSLAARFFPARRPLPFQQFVLWALRPWTLWALFNLIFRWRGDQGFNNRSTFPFYANPWPPDEGLAPAILRLLHSSAWIGWMGLSLLLALAIVGLLAWHLRSKPSRPWLSLATLYILAVALHLSLACLPHGAWTNQGRSGSLLAPWHIPGSTMLHVMPRIQSSPDFLNRFLEIQPKLRASIHGLSHPPLASLSLHWIGQLMGIRERNIYSPEVRLRYAIGLTLFGALNLLVLYFLGRHLFDAQTGFLTAVLWTTAPAVSAYATFAQDSIYALFFNLALLFSWHVLHSGKHTFLWAILLGLDFFVLVFMNYSWCLATTLFALFALASGIRHRWNLRAIALRLLLPLSIMTLLSLAFLARFHLDYWAMYQYSHQFVILWYPMTGIYQWTMALIGGQFDLFLLLGSIPASAFASSLLRNLRIPHLREPRVQFLLIVLGVYALPLLFGPNCLKMETARCWIWVASLPLAFAASRLLLMPHRIFVFGTPFVSVLTYAVLRLFLNFGI